MLDKTRVMFGPSGMIRSLQEHINQGTTVAKYFNRQMAKAKQ